MRVKKKKKKSQTHVSKLEFEDQLKHVSIRQIYLFDILWFQLDINEYGVYKKKKKRRERRGKERKKKAS